MQSNSHQPTNTGYFSSIYHPLITNPYYATMNPNASQTIYGSASHMPMPIMDHAMHLRSQYYNETMPTQSGLPCYLAVTSSSRDLANSNITRWSGYIWSWFENGKLWQAMGLFGIPWRNKLADRRNFWWLKFGHEHWTEDANCRVYLYIMHSTDPENLMHMTTKAQFSPSSLSFPTSTKPIPSKANF